MSSKRSTGTVDLGAGSTINGAPIGSGGGGGGLQSETRAPSTIYDTNLGAGHVINWEGLTARAVAYLGSSAQWDNGTFDAELAIFTSISDTSTGVLAMGQTFGWRRIVPPSFTAWSANAVVLQYAVEGFGADVGNNDYTLNLSCAIQDADGNTISSKTADFAVDTTHTAFQTFVFSDTDLAALGAGDGFVMTFSLSQSGSLNPWTFYFGSLSFGWS